MQANLLAQLTKMMDVKGTKGLPTNTSAKGQAVNADALFAKLMKLVNSNASTDEIVNLVEKETKNLNNEDKELVFDVMSDFLEEGSSVEQKMPEQLINIKNEEKIVSTNKETALDSIFKKNDVRDEKLLSILDKGTDLNTVKNARAETSMLAETQPKIEGKLASLLNNDAPVMTDMKKVALKESLNNSPKEAVKVQSSDDFLNNLAMMKKPGQAQSQLASANQNSNFFSVSKFQKEQSVLDNGIIKTKKSDFFKTSSKEEKDGELKIDGNSHAFAKEEATLAMLTKDGIRPVEKMSVENSTNNQVKVLDLNSLNTTDANQVIEKISNYIVQSKINNTDTLDLVVKHDSLGQFNVLVNKTQGSDLIDLQIRTATAEGNQFFAKHETELLKHLGQNGVKVADLKIAMNDAITMSNGSEMKKNTDSGSQFSQNQNHSSHANNSFSGDFGRGGEQRRKDLWQEYRERLGA
ncbi:hypothetical protein M899_1272 [Bacteriovorax sp. BSW11_IV]|uniref:hypothetical protein n=1 Tax=Bacteriovorax sp. BSW11_IV TaxID=1353529 RepID=UPI00038A34B6|nr:hypothetical protein [Bacteriovorax sp. BSW11_IV]EQC45797.1 hypothetical protein M899_1272 [Bacteriovorax sp. BSW11_IV]